MRSLSGIDNRQVQLCMHRHNYDEVKLERKRKTAGYILKDQYCRQECDNILQGDYGFLLNRHEPLLRKCTIISAA